ncbi:RNA-binding S4 domain-containing protein [Fusobacterium massiliense]|jgi:S4 domain protein yaaA|uniref:RNA-binding S4 domain-containing protein n=1 Tax=Fusobacterium massiliense TaxID=1852365 RepID=UPI0028D68648|nr:RNA-binding S4 domain-containing protein [Fusobacterium massiliense]
MQEIEKVKITTEFIKLDQCLKWLAVVGSGSEAKEIIINEEVKVNGEIEVRRGRKIYPGYKIEVFDRVFEIE